MCYPKTNGQGSLDMDVSVLNGLHVKSLTIHMSFFRFFGYKYFHILISLFIWSDYFQMKDRMQELQRIEQEISVNQTNVKEAEDIMVENDKMKKFLWIEMRLLARHGGYPQLHFFPRVILLCLYREPNP